MIMSFSVALFLMNVVVAILAGLQNRKTESAYEGEKIGYRS
jgi:hypothetical protein